MGIVNQSGKEKKIDRRIGLLPGMVRTERKRVKQIVSMDPWWKWMECGEIEGDEKSESEIVTEV